MKTKILAAVLILGALPARALEWTAADTALHAVSSGLIVTDWMQTQWIRTRPATERRETNVLLGPAPSRARVNLYFASCLAGHTAVALLLPKTYRRIWESTVIGVEAGYVGWNVSVGVRLALP